MLEPLLGSTNAERELIFLLAREEGSTCEAVHFQLQPPLSLSG